MDWYPWGEEALTRAREEDRPILLSIGYSACHWCHVMERESFEDEETARAHERALRVHQARPRGAPRPRLDLHGGLPGDDRRGRLAAERLPHARAGARSTPAPTSRPSRAWACRAGARCSRRWPTPGTSAATRSAPAATRIAERLRGGALLAARRPSRSSAARSTRRSRRCAGSYDPANGGFGGAPKFPPASAIEFLLRARRDRDDARTRCARWPRAACTTRSAAASRATRSTPYWLVPHFEKMLYDNALLARAYLHGWQVTGEPLFRRVVRGDARLGAARDARARGRLLSPRSTPTPRAWRASSTSGRVEELREALGRARRRRGDRLVRRHRRAATSRARTSPCAAPGEPERPRRLAATPVRGARRSASGPGSTTSA